MAFIKKYYVWAIIIAVILVAGGLFFKKSGKQDNTPAGQNTPATLQADKDSSQEMLQSQQQGKVMEGTLKKSNNSQKGNLMLVSASTTIYIFTSRDYSALVDKQVKMIYDGTPEDFRLGDIVEK